MMRKAAAFAVLASCALSVRAADEATTPEVVLPTALTWTSPPNNPALQGAWVLGAEQQPGPYILRVKLAADGKIAPHTHPDERNSTVLSGTLYVGFGKTFDAAKMVAIPPGGVYVVPANMPHFAWAKEGEVIYQEAGVAPTATNYVGR